MYEININTEKYSLEDLSVFAKKEKDLSLIVTLFSIFNTFKDDNVCDRITLPY